MSTWNWIWLKFYALRVIRSFVGHVNLETLDCRKSCQIITSKIIDAAGSKRVWSGKTFFQHTCTSVPTVPWTKCQIHFLKRFYLWSRCTRARCFYQITWIGFPEYVANHKHRLCKGIAWSACLNIDEWLPIKIEINWPQRLDRSQSNCATSFRNWLCRLSFNFFSVSARRKEALAIS